VTILRSARARAALTALAGAALWTALALAFPTLATTDSAALVVILAVGLVVAAVQRGAGRRLLPLVLLASAGSALLIFLILRWFLPAMPGFISTSHPPTYNADTRLVDPVAELAVALLLTVVFGVDLLRSRIRSRRAAEHDRRSGRAAGPNEMVVERNV
jgi:hypothetical protein